MAETTPGPAAAPPRRPHTSLGAGGALGFVTIIVLMVLATDCREDQTASDEPQPPRATTTSAEVKSQGGDANDAGRLHLGRECGEAGLNRGAGRHTSAHPWHSPRTNRRSDTPGIRIRPEVARGEPR